MWFLQRSSTVEVRLDSKYTSVHLHTGQPHRTYMHIEYFRCKVFLRAKEEWNKWAVSEVKEISKVYISYYFIRIHFLWFISSDAFRVNPKAKYSTHFFVVLQKVLRETETSIMSLSRRWFLLNSRQIPWWIYNWVYFKQSCTNELVENFTKSEFIPGQHRDICLYNKNAH